MLVEKKTLGQLPFWSRALISVPGACASSLVTVSHPLVENPGVDIWVPDWVAVALVRTFQPAAPRSVTAVEPLTASAPEARESTGRGRCAGGGAAPGCGDKRPTPSTAPAPIRLLFSLSPN